MFEVDFKADLTAIVFSCFLFCRTVNTYLQTQPKHKLFEVDFKVDSTAILFWFFVCRDVDTYALAVNST